jgi:hypothetical protein
VSVCVLCFVWQDELFENVGMRHVFDALTASQKPLIGHNMFLDLLHVQPHHRVFLLQMRSPSVDVQRSFFGGAQLLQRFESRPLPATMDDFKALLARLFPTYALHSITTDNLPSFVLK